MPFAFGEHTSSAINKSSASFSLDPKFAGAFCFGHFHQQPFWSLVNLANSVLFTVKVPTVYSNGHVCAKSRHLLGMFRADQKDISLEQKERILSAMHCIERRSIRAA